MKSIVKKIHALNIEHPWLLINTAAVLFILSVVIFTFGVNQSLFLWLQNWGRLLPESFWASITLLGDALTASVLLLLFSRKYPNVIWAGILAALVTTVVVQTLKHSLVLPRPPMVIAPEVLMLIGPEYHHASFPSGHSCVIWLLAGVWLLSQYSWPKIVAVLSLASLVSLSRVMVGAHWPVDITTGALIGWLGAWGGVVMARRWRWGMTLKGRRIIVAILLIAAVALIGYDSGYPQAGYLVNIIAITCLLFGAYQFYVLMRYPQRLNANGRKTEH
ncbi:phosphatase PAP2 family protein [Kaarinaea lacus]